MLNLHTVPGTSTVTYSIRNSQFSHHKHEPRLPDRLFFIFDVVLVSPVYHMYLVSLINADSYGITRTACHETVESLEC